jgi:hypothetical protein
MRRGDFARAWRISDRLLADRVARGEPQHHLPRHVQAVWNGQSLTNRRVLVRCYHGLGDTVQFIRFARPLRALARDVTVWVQPPLMPLAATAAGVDRVLPLHDGVPDIDYDLDIEIMELAHALRIAPSDLPGPIPYLYPRAMRARTHDTPFTAGLVWSGGDWDPRRFMPFDALTPLIDVSNVRFVTLQRGPAAAQCRRADIADVSSDDVSVFAARLIELDLLITIDSFPAHLAGALGVPVWMMLHSDCDWRWLEGGDTSPWYPSMRLFRQHRSGAWREVISDLAHALARHVSQRCATKSRNKATDLTFAP